MKRIYLCVIASLALLSVQTMIMLGSAAPINDETGNRTIPETIVSSTTRTPTVLENNFKQMVMNSSDVDRVYIDRLSVEELDKYQKSGELPDRTMSLIRRYLQEQVGGGNGKDSAAGVDELLKDVVKGGIHETAAETTSTTTS